MSFDPDDNPAVEVIFSGVVWEDANENGIRERSEDPLHNVQIQIRSANPGDEGAEPGYVYTDAFGKYEVYDINLEFIPEPPWELTINPGENRIITEQDVGLDDSVDSDFDQETGTALAVPTDKIDAGLVPVKVAEAESPPEEAPVEEAPGEGAGEDSPGDGEGAGGPAEGDPDGGDPGEGDAPPRPVVGSTTLCTDHTLAPAEGPEWYGNLGPTLTVKDNFLVFSMNIGNIPDDQPFCGGFDGYSDGLPQLPLIEGCANCEKTSVSGVTCRDDLGDLRIQFGYARADGKFVAVYTSAEPEVAEDTVTMSIPLEELIGQVDWWRLTGSDMNTCWALSDYGTNNGFVNSSDVSLELAEGMVDFDFNRFCTDFVCFSGPAGATLTDVGKGTWAMEVDGFNGNLGVTLTPGTFDVRKSEFESSGWSFGEEGFVPDGTFLPFQGNVMQANGLTYGPIAGAEVGSPEDQYVLTFYFFGPDPVPAATAGGVYAAFGSILSSARLVVPAE